MSAADGPATRGAMAGTVGTPPHVTARDAPAAPAQRHRRTGREPAWWWWTAGYVVAAILLFLCYLRISGTQAVTSDGASNALQAWDMLHGNLWLHGWALTDVSFYTTELPEYALVELLRGLGPADVHIAAALSYTLLVVLAGLLAKGRATGISGLVRVLIASGIMIAPEIGPGAFILLLSPDHTGTGVPLLLIFLLLDRAPRRWWVPVAAGLLLVWVQIGDRLAFTIGALPIVVVCAVRAYQGLAQRREPMSSRWFELTLGGAALVSEPVASVVVKTIGHLGGFVVAPLQTTFDASANWPAHLSLMTEGILGLYGADITGRPLGVFAAVALLHLAGLALAAWAFARAIRRFFGWEDMIVQILAVTIVVNLAAYFFSILPRTFWDTREIAAVLPFGAVLAGRLLADQLTAARLLPLLGACLLGYVFALGYGISRPNPPAHDQALTNWLAAHHLTGGLGSYAEGNSVTIDSGGSIQLRAANFGSSGVSPGTHNSQSSWYDPR
ncbi:MAG: hypothetical protein JO242_20290, partial [Streptosporangiaceae bacterium]|nr:hypothetical protein [Streptosporangiaceae bacterium]